jgi:hypothetical protein
LFEETDGDNCFFRTILNGDYGGLGVQRAVFSFDDDVVGKFHGMIDREQDLARSAELDDGVLNKDAIIFFVFFFVFAGPLITIALAVRTAELDGNPDRSGSGKEFGQAGYDALFERVSSCLVGHVKPRPRKMEQTNLPLFPVRKVCEEISSALSALE